MGKKEEKHEEKKWNKKKTNLIAEIQDTGPTIWGCGLFGALLEGKEGWGRGRSFRSLLWVYMLVIETVSGKMTKEEFYHALSIPTLVRVTGLASPLCGSMCHMKGMKSVIDADKIHK